MKLQKIILCATTGVGKKLFLLDMDRHCSCSLWPIVHNLQLCLGFVSLAYLIGKKIYQGVSQDSVLNF